MKTFRKSSLISSIALLLVAIVALSGATFAWFSTNNTATAGKLDMTATSASGLFIVESDLATVTAPTDGWSSKIEWTDVAEALPAVSGTLNGTTSFFKTSTDNADGTWNGEDEIQAAVVGTDYIAKKIWVKADTTEEVTLTITPTVAGTTKGYERVAIVDENGNATIMDNSGAVYKAFADQAGTEEDVTPVNYGAVTFTGTFDTAKAYTVYCWFEGQDAQCKNVNSAANFTLDLAFAI